MIVRNTILHERMRQDLQLAGLSSRTQYAYIREVRLLTQHFQQPADELTDEQIREYLLHLMTNTRLAPPSIKMALHGIRRTYHHTLARNLEGLPRVRVPAGRTLPDVLTLCEVRRIIEAEPALHYRTYFWTVYSLGIRLNEALHLQPGHIDTERRLVHVHLGKGAVDRFVPLPTRTLELLREYWLTHRNRTWLFPAKPWKPELASIASAPMAMGSVQHAMRRAVRKVGLTKRVSIHTLRHSYATHLLEAGVSIRLIQQYLGHRKLETTMLYLHLTTRGQEWALDIIDS
jgi:site-specific recombinase XerD